VRSAPNTGVIRDRAFSFTRSVLSGFSFVPGGWRVKWLTVWPSRSVTSTSPLRRGSIDDVRIYNRALSAQEVALLYALGQVKVADINKTSLTSGLVGYWSFDGGTLHWNTGKVDDL